MAGESKSTVLIATISAVSAVVIAGITTYGTIVVSAPEARKVKKELEGTSDFQQEIREEISGLRLKAEEEISDVRLKARELKKELEDISDLRPDFRVIANLPIGTIVPSMLHPSLFAQAVGDVDRDTPEWVLADGQKIAATSRYSQKTGETVAPDLRGVFLRGMNVNGGKDPQQNRTAGDYQPDAFAGHDHGLFFHYRSFKGEGGKGRPALDAATSAKYDTPMEGADETRPKNVAVYFYIKIN